jgi:hypothetical protein
MYSRSRKKKLAGYDVILIEASLSSPFNSTAPLRDEKEREMCSAHFP